MTAYLIYFATGTVFGSFFYTLALRYINGSMKENFIRALFSRSECPSCGTVLSLVSLIPLFGYVILKGRCRSCHGGISFLYPLMEILYGLLALSVACFHGTDLSSFFIYLISALCVTISVIDMKIMIIPLSLVVVFILFSLYPVIMHNNPADNFFGFLLLSAFFLIIIFILPGAFGGGDLKFYAAAGFLLGLEMSVVLLEVSLVLGTVCGIIWVLVKGGGFRQKA
jgi:leader peptidase (prepilin peptidase)/N-methyltransferase